MAVANKNIPNLREWNAVNLLTTNASEENKAYIVDKRLVDFLLSKVTTGTLEMIKEDLVDRVTHAVSKDDLFQQLDDYIYLNKIANLVPKEPRADGFEEVKEPAGAVSI